MSEKSLALLSKAKVALMKADTLDAVVKIRNSAKAVRSVLKDTLDARDRSLEAEALELLAEHKAGKLLNVLKADRAGGNLEVSVAGACKEANINPELAKFWQSVASSEGMNEDSISRYVEFVQNSDDPSIIRAGITLQGFVRFILKKNLVMNKEERHDWAVMLLKNGTEEALDAFVDVALRGAKDDRAKHLRDAKKGILEAGLIPRGKKQEGADENFFVQS
jgi:hypothetical protein